MKDNHTRGLRDIINEIHSNSEVLFGDLVNNNLGDYSPGYIEELEKLSREALQYIKKKKLFNYNEKDRIMNQINQDTNFIAKPAKHYQSSLAYYSNEAGFFAALGLQLIWQEDAKLKAHYLSPESYSYNHYSPTVVDSIYWYFKMAAHYGILALSELERE